MKLNELEKYINMHNDKFYHRNPKIVAEYLEKVFFNKKILFYGAGKHTKEAIDFLSNKSFIKGIVKEANVKDDYIEYDFEKIPKFKEQDILNLDFDYLILLGNWSESNAKLLCKKLGISKRKIYLPYKDKIVKLKILQEPIKHKLTAPTIVFLSWDAKNDIFSEAILDIVNKFCCIKFWLSSYYFDNPNDQFFDTVWKLEHYKEKDRLVVILEILHLLKPDIIISTKPTANETFFNYLLMKYKPKESKFIFAPWGDIIFYKVTTLTNEDFSHITENFSTEEVKILRDCEKKLIQESDGIISSLLGPYKEKVLKKESKKLFTTIYFIHQRHFVFNNRNISKSIKICYTGALDCVENKDDIWRLAMDHSNDYNTILQQGIHLDIYSFEHNRTKCYKKLTEKYSNCTWHPNVKHWDLPEKIKNYDFGLIWSNLTNNVKEKLNLGPKSIFLAKAITYIAAGIPILVIKDAELMSRFVLKNNIGIAINKKDLKNIKKILEASDYQTLKNNVKSFQERYKKYNNIYKLKNFLLEIIESNKERKYLNYITNANYFINTINKNRKAKQLYINNDIIKNINFSVLKEKYFSIVSTAEDEKRCYDFVNRVLEKFEDIYYFISDNDKTNKNRINYKFKNRVFIIPYINIFILEQIDLYIPMQAFDEINIIREAIKYGKVGVRSPFLNNLTIKEAFIHHTKDFFKNKKLPYKIIGKNCQKEFIVSNPKDLYYSYLSGILPNDIIEILWNSESINIEQSILLLDLFRRYEKYRKYTLKNWEEVFLRTNTNQRNKKENKIKGKNKTLIQDFINLLN